MIKNIRILTANPAGNVTIFVLDKFERSQYQGIATQLLAIEELHGEQVAFVTGEHSMEMCGLEFCGNASRSFALMLAKDRGINGDAYVEICVSGCDEPLSVFVNTERNYTRIKMPNPLSVKDLTFTYQKEDADVVSPVKVVDFGGILHVIVTNQNPTRENFEYIKGRVYEKLSPPAFGVMFFDAEKNFLTPVVYVKDVDTTYFEGSCGSGATAVAAAFTDDESDGTFSFKLPQPAGTITATIEKRDGAIDAIYIEGSVSFSEAMQVPVEIPEAGL